MPRNFRFVLLVLAFAVAMGADGVAPVVAQVKLQTQSIKPSTPSSTPQPQTPPATGSTPGAVTAAKPTNSATSGIPNPEPELILDVDAQVRFSWIMLGREPRSTRELLMVYAGILAHGTALSAAETARMIPLLSPASVRQAMKWASDDATISSVQRPQRSESGAHLTEN